MGLIVAIESLVEVAESLRFTQGHLMASWERESEREKGVQ